MKTIKYFVMVITTAFIFAGCAGVQVKVPHGMTNKLSLFKKGKVYIFTLNEDMNSKKEIIRAFGLNFNSIAVFGLSKGYSYMALVNSKFNNLQGYPINSWKSMKKFIDLWHKKHFNVSFYNSKALVLGDQAHFKVVFLKERPKGLFVWNLKRLKSNTDKYSN